MKAAVLRGAGEPLRIEDVDVAEPIGHEVLVRVAAVGVCRSDLHHIEGLYPTISKGSIPPTRPCSGTSRRGWWRRSAIRSAMCARGTT